MKIVGVDYEDGKVVSVDVTMDNSDHRIHLNPERLGHWEEKDDHRYLVKRFIGDYTMEDEMIEIRCSECNRYIDFDASRFVYLANYCPNCGAKMRETKEKEKEN